MDQERLETACLEILNDTTRTEEDKIEDVEDFVRGNTQGLDDASLERLVLDMLWAHRQGKKSKPKVKIANQKDSKAINVPAKPSKKKYVPLDEVEKETEPLATVEASPYDMLQQLFGENNTEEDIDRLLAHNEFDIGRTVDMLLHSDTGVGPSDPELLLTQQTAQRVVCKYFLTGNCARGNDCMYSHDLALKICRFWLQGRCLAGSNCIFLHEVPQEVIDKLRASKKPTQRQTAPPSLDSKKLPTLGNLPKLGSIKKKNAPNPSAAVQNSTFDLSSVSLNVPKKDISAMVNRGMVSVKPPLRLPWEKLDYGVNAQYVELRALAKRSSEYRNKYLQLATDSWAANDPASAKLLSKKGQGFNLKMIEQYRKAADILYDYSSKPGSEIFIDLHGLELGAAIDHLEKTLIEIEEGQKHSPRVAYIISGRGHYKQKRHADQLSQHVKAFLDRYGYNHKNFGENLTYGRLVGLDPWSCICPH